MRISDGYIENPRAVFCVDGSDFLSHYGILGMKWGVRNEETKARYSREKAAKKARAQEEKNLRTKRKNAKVSRAKQKGINREKVKTINEERLEANRNRALLSDAELDRRINRLQKEQRLNQLTQSELQPGRYAVKKALVNVGTETVKTTGKKVTKAAVAKATGGVSLIATKPRSRIGAASRVVVSKQ